MSGVQYVGFRLPSVDTKDNSCQKQWHGVRLVNNEENVILVLFLGFNDKRNNSSVREESLSLVDCWCTLRLQRDALNI